MRQVRKNMSKTNYTPIISVVMPAYNAGKYIGQAIESVMAQTMRDWELIIVDDCSTDETLGIAGHYAEKDRRIRIIKRDKRAGRAFEPRSDAILAARTEWISKLDADDILAPDCLELLMKRREETGADIVLPTVYKFSDAVSPFLFLPKSEKFYKGIYSGRELVKYTLNGWRIAISGGLTRRELFLSVYNKYTYPDENKLIDELCSRHLLLENPKIAFSKGLYYYRITHETDSTDRLETKLDYLHLTLALINLLEEKFGKDSEEYLRVHQQNFYNIFDMYKLMNSSAYSDNDFRKGNQVIKRCRQAIDWKVLDGNVSPRYRFLLKTPGLPIQLILRLFRKE